MNYSVANVVKAVVLSAVAGFGTFWLTFALLFSGLYGGSDNWWSSGFGLILTYMILYGLPIAAGVLVLVRQLRYGK